MPHEGNRTSSNGAAGVPAENSDMSDSQPRADSPASSTGRGGILEALRGSPLVGAESIAERPFEPGRQFDL